MKNLEKSFDDNIGNHWLSHTLDINNTTLHKIYNSKQSKASERVD